LGQTETDVKMCNFRPKTRQIFGTIRDEIFEGYIMHNISRNAATPDIK